MPQDKTGDNISGSPSEDDILKALSHLDGDDDEGDSEQASPPADEEEDEDRESPDSQSDLDNDTESDAESHSDQDSDVESESSDDSEAPETTETNKEGAEDGAEEESRIPYDRFQQVIKQRNEYKADAEALRGIRKVYEDAKIDPSVFQGWNDLGLRLFTKQASAVQEIAQIAKQLGLRVESDIPADLKPFVDSGELDEGAARKLAQSRIANTIPQPSPYSMPALQPSAVQYTAEMASAEINEVGDDFRARYPDIFTDEVMKEAAAEISRLEAEAERLTGSKPSLDRYGMLANDACKIVAAKYRSKTKTPDVKALRTSQTSKVVSKKKYTSVADYIDNDPRLKNL